MKERETVDAIYQQIITLIQLYSVNKQVKGGLDLCISTLLLHHSKCPWTFLFLSPYQLPPKKAKIKTKIKTLCQVINNVFMWALGTDSSKGSGSGRKSSLKMLAQ